VFLPQHCVCLFSVCVCLSVCVSLPPRCVGGSLSQCLCVSLSVGVCVSLCVCFSPSMCVDNSHCVCLFQGVCLCVTPTVRETHKHWERDPPTHLGGRDTHTERHTQTLKIDTQHWGGNTMRQIHTHREWDIMGARYQSQIPTYAFLLAEARRWVFYYYNSLKAKSELEPQTEDTN